MGVVGVTGHRALDVPDVVADAVDAALDRIVAAGGWDEGTVVTSLAEGADRLVALRALARPGWNVDVVLPLDADDYADDFADTASRTEFEQLCDAAHRVGVVAPQGSRVEAYLAAGLEVLHRSDVLLTIWDGEPARGVGGTAEIVERARAEDLPLVWIRPDGSASDERLDRLDGIAP